MLFSFLLEIVFFSPAKYPTGILSKYRSNWDDIEEFGRIRKKVSARAIVARSEGTI